MLIRFKRLFLIILLVSLTQQLAIAKIELLKDVIFEPSLNLFSGSQIIDLQARTRKKIKAINARFIQKKSQKDKNKKTDSEKNMSV